MRNYKVLWFDDEHEKFQSIKDEAILENIQLIGYTNSDEGGVELRRNFKDYDAILLDGLFLQKKNQKGTDLKQTAFGEIAKILTELKAKGFPIPWFIYSGQPSFVKDSNTIVDIFKDSAFAKGKVFDKNKDDDFVELLAEIKNAADTNPVRKIKLAYPDIFEIFDSGLLPEETEAELLDVFQELDKPDDIDFKAVLTKMRSVQEKIFIKLDNIGVLQGQSFFTQKAKHLSGNISRNGNGDYVPTSVVYQSSEIENLQKWVYYTCGTYIHALQQQHYGGYMISKYSLKSMFFGLLELLLWFKKTYSDNK